VFQSMEQLPNLVMPTITIMTIIMVNLHTTT
jgi:hypothetical protein